MNNKKPVYVIDYAPSKLQVLIDGNHRVASRAIHYKDPERSIDGILVPSKVHVKAMATDFQKVFYKVMSNIGETVNYLELLSKNEKIKKPHLFNMSSYL